MKIQTATKWLVAASAAVAMIGCNGGESSDKLKTDRYKLNQHRI